MATMICFPPILPVRRTLLTYVSEGCNSAVTDWNCESVTVGNLSWADCLCIVWRTGSNGLSLPTEPAVVQLQHCQCSSALAVSLNGSSDCPQQLDFSLQHGSRAVGCGNRARGCGSHAIGCGSRAVGIGGRAATTPQPQPQPRGGGHAAAAPLPCGSPAFRNGNRAGGGGGRTVRGSSHAAGDDSHPGGHAYPEDNHSRSRSRSSSHRGNSTAIRRYSWAIRGHGASHESSIPGLLRGCGHGVADPGLGSRFTGIPGSGGRPHPEDDSLQDRVSSGQGRGRQERRPGLGRAARRSTRGRRLTSSAAASTWRATGAQPRTPVTWTHPNGRSSSNRTPLSDPLALSGWRPTRTGRWRWTTQETPPGWRYPQTNNGTDPTRDPEGSSVPAAESWHA